MSRHVPFVSQMPLVTDAPPEAALSVQDRQIRMIRGRTEEGPHGRSQPDRAGMVRVTTDAANAGSPRLRRLLEGDPRRFYYPFMLLLLVVIAVILRCC